MGAIVIRAWRKRSYSRWLTCTVVLLACGEDDTTTFQPIPAIELHLDPAPFLYDFAIHGPPPVTLDVYLGHDHPFPVFVTGLGQREPTSPSLVVPTFPEEGMEVGGARLVPIRFDPSVSDRATGSTTVELEFEAAVVAGSDGVSVQAAREQAQEEPERWVLASTVVPFTVAWVCDRDRDGFDATFCGGGDCNDHIAWIHPSADERCNAIDDDCDNLIDNNPVDGENYFLDDDGDGFGRDVEPLRLCHSPGQGWATNEADCDDEDNTIHPGASDDCSAGRDRNCDGQVEATCQDVDSDGDGLPDWVEQGLCTDPLNPDTDGDGLSDYLEVTVYFSDPCSPDGDGDGLRDGRELFNHQTDPNDEDTDDDLLTDADEVEMFLTNPRDPDTDGDGISDFDEIFVHESDPHDPLSP